MGRESLLQEMTFVLGPAKGRPGRRVFQTEDQQEQRPWGRSVPGVLEEWRPVWLQCWKKQEDGMV